jgi:4a-hydroxytetrahydrobiopterin dehydratase
MQTIEVTFYTRRDCRLCDEAKRAIHSVRLPIDLHEIDVDGDPGLQARFGEDVPVIYVAGREAFRHRVKRNEFEAYIRGAAIMLTLANEKCVPCRGGVPPLKGKELGALTRELGGDWRVIDEHHLEKEFRFANFVEALAFTNKIGVIAEEQGHHPDIYLAWGKVRVTIWTHKIDGLTRSDFVLAAKIDRG